MAFTQVFLQHAGSARAALAASDDLEPTLANLFETATLTWPDVAVSRQEFMRHLAEKLAAHPAPAAALKTTQAGDLYLAFACSKGDETAMRLLDKHFLTAATAHVTRGEQSPTFSDDLRQRLRTRLFMPQEAAPARIARYTGQGPLRVWLRTVASRIAIDLRREDKTHQVVDSPALEIRAPGLDPELDYMRTLYRGELRQAFRATLSALSAEEDNILRLHFLEGMTVAALASLYGTSERTMTRRIAEARRGVLDETRRLLAEHLRLPESQVNTLMAMAQSQMHSIVSECFNTPAGPDNKD